MEFRGRVFKAGRIVRFSPKNAKQLVRSGQLLDVDSFRPINVIHSGVRLPDEIVILGTGPNGVPHYKQLEGKFTAGLNKAVYAMPLNIWAAQDPNLPRYKWFNDKCMALRAQKRGFDAADYKAGRWPIPMFDRTRVQKYYPWFPLTFDVTKPMLGGDPKRINVRSLRIAQGATVCGSFIQVAIHLGAKRIILCGIDMFGNVYFDGSKHKQASRKGHVWSSYKALDALIKAARDHGIDIVTVSKTALRNAPLVEL